MIEVNGFKKQYKSASNREQVKIIIKRYILIIYKIEMRVYRIASKDTICGLHYLSRDRTASF